MSTIKDATKILIWILGILTGYTLFDAISGLGVHTLGVRALDETVEPIDPQFSTNSCIIRADYAPPDCTLAPPDRFIPEEEPNPYLECSKDGNANEDESELIFADTQMIFEQLEDAIDNCPYDPVLIEFTGTIYMLNNPFIYYNGTKDIIFRGISQFVEGYTEELKSVIVGLKDWQIKHQNISITFDNVVLEGCSTKGPIFFNKVR